MAKNDDKKNQTQNHPGNKGKGKSDDKQSTSGAGSQSGQHSSSAQGAKIGNLMNIIPRNSLMFGTAEDDVGQLGVGVVNRHTGQLARNEMCVSTFRGKPAISRSVDDASCLPEVADIAEQVKEGNQIGSGLVSMTDLKAFMEKCAKRKVIALDSEDEERIEAGRALKRSRASFLQQQRSDQQGTRPQTQGDGQDQGRPPDKPQRRLFCVGCKSNKHRLDSCLKAGNDGLMKGCPRCNTLRHNASNCRSINTDKDRFILFVKKRCNMPSFLDFNTWFLLASAVGGLTAQDRFPWTAEFAKFIADDIEQLQNDLDTLGLGGEFVLPEDPRLLGWRAVEAYHKRRAEEDQKALDASRDTVVIDGIPMNKKRAAMMLADDS
ncbi:hypothetical protein FOXG_04504 [Fusarium oxysporum f. sp. lycopersici 4287]|uniref:CCHC-type domain-containing protein n=3 Tax=Fusarium oxysporum TaxID=5507 RepID=A0A0J9UQI5_FUSO4|nr:hypothetical protein FOXG_04504 [Fusarium oxysporum f. sp. lycopersici 4287]EXK43689.1 hypothetical protein FOMG_02622 [Fusarium oxysporum f. sp. melonis 26406]KAJ9427665.1 hypothetical protein QL093DRAFT_2055311 [Fusarium oxysporum]KNB01223.1 hypothetical protein FOXG_04504 [Fusarium oxysporum f. sp. lycopersici 4287]